MLHVATKVTTCRSISFEIQNFRYFGIYCHKHFNLGNFVSNFD